MVCPQPVSPCAFTEESWNRGVLKQACFIPQQDEMLRVQSCLCASHCNSDIPGWMWSPTAEETLDWTYLYTSLILSLWGTNTITQQSHYYRNESGLWEVSQELDMRACSPTQIYKKGCEKKNLLFEARLHSVLKNTTQIARSLPISAQNLPFFFKECYLGSSSLNLLSRNDSFWRGVALSSTQCFTGSNTLLHGPGCMVLLQFFPLRASVSGFHFRYC